METFTIPRTDLEVSRIACGCMHVGGPWDATPLAEADVARAADLVRAACDGGITIFDHADIYARGKSEAAFGRVLAETPSLRDRIVLQSKCGIRLEGDPGPEAPGRYDFSRGHIESSVEESLRRLRTDHLDLLLLHRPDPLVDVGEVAAAFARLLASGKVRYFGVSNHTVGQLALLQSQIDLPLVVNQVQLSLWHLPLIDEGVEANRAGTTVTSAVGLLDYCRQHEVLVQAYSPLGKGRHLGAPAPDAAGTGDGLPQVLQAVARDRGVSREAIAIAWLLRHPAGIQPVTGTTRPERLRACGEAGQIALTREEWYRLYVAARGTPLP